MKAKVMRDAHELAELLANNRLVFDGALADDKTITGKDGKYSAKLAGPLVVTENGIALDIANYDWTNIAILIWNIIQIQTGTGYTGAVTNVTNVYTSGTTIKKTYQTLTFTDGLLTTVGSESTVDVDVGTTCL